MISGDRAIFAMGMEALRGKALGNALTGIHFIPLSKGKNNHSSRITATPGTGRSFTQKKQLYRGELPEKKICIFGTSKKQ